jgi:hypothetical protein
VYKSSRAYGGIGGPVQSVRSKDLKHNMLLHNTILKYLICFIDYLDSLTPNKQQIGHEMLVAVSISLQFYSFCSTLRPKLPDDEFQIHGG